MFPADTYAHTGTKRTSPLTLTEWNDVGDYLQAVTEKLGVNPQGGYGTVRAWLDALQGSLALLGATGYRNLLVANNATTPNSTVDVTADLLGIEGYVAGDVSVTADIAVEGKNGFDNLSADAEDANTWYYVWVGYRPATDERCGLLSKASSRASLVLSHSSLVGFTAFRRVGAVRNDGSSNFRAFQQQDGCCLYATADGGDARVLTNDRTTSMTAVSCAAMVPPTSRLAQLLAILIPTGGTGTCYLGAAAGDAGFLPAGVATGGEDHRAAVWMRLTAAQQVYAKFGGTATGGGMGLEVLGYQDTI
jgi:hypothetical protein